ncbi:MAG: hypothetical protein A9183_03010 [Dehalococcoides mccartyi]|uniref:site-specific DNA-methyltransferase n=1 Tax=Dehalococcoides mccartyi TaxID=61435 RepID=UPI000804FCA6|nr:site-specific DNA-methyltransferase [Dehalococcoides mccartyi]OBW61088.1 MAG: hypothetical protein A9183_03010 [Dehalococcoides mccartyi]
MDIRTISINDIKPAAYNPRKDLKPGDAEYIKLKKSITEFDMVEPLIWNETTGNLVGGHQRLKVLKEMGRTEVEVSVVKLSDAKEKALNIALNKISGEWDMPLLKDLLEEINTGAFDVEITGFDDKEIEELMTQFHVPGEGLTDDDAIPENVETICKTGDLWQLGTHRLLCGDATIITDVERLMGGEKADMVFTDPPWNVAIGLDSNPRHRQRKGLVNDNLGINFDEFLQGWCSCCLPLLIGDIYCVMGCGEWPTIDKALRSNNIHWSATIVWVKDIFVLGRSNYHRRFEPIWYGWPDGKSSSFNGKRDLDDVWEIKRPKRSEEHPTMKPVELIEMAINNSSQLKNIVLDPFLGSGTTLIACEKLSRKCYGMEIDEHYCDVIIKRWEKYTGSKAVKIQ